MKRAVVRNNQDYLINKLEVNSFGGKEIKHFRVGIGEGRREIQFVQSHWEAAKKKWAIEVLQEKDSCWGRQPEKEVVKEDFIKCVSEEYIRQITENRRRGTFQMQFLCEDMACIFALLQPFLKKLLAAAAGVISGQ